MRLILAILALISVIFGWSQSAVAQPKRLAPGVLKVIAPNIDARDSYSLPLPLEDLDAKPYAPNYAPVTDTLYGQTQSVVFFRDVWQYEFAFLGLRQAKLKLATVNGTETKNVWYLVYRIRNTGASISYEPVREDQRFEHVKNTLKRDSEDFQVSSKFLPQFYLHGWVRQADGSFREVRYRDQIDPQALRLIRQIEDKNRYLLDKVEMMSAGFPVVKSAEDGGLWGVALWHDVAPDIDFVSVTVRGLTNAFRIGIDDDGGRDFKYRVLQLNFWRPGDSVRQDEDRITYGIPLVDDPMRQIEICKRYRLPGPLIRGYLVSPAADQNVLVAEIDAGIQLPGLESEITPLLDQGKLPAPLRSAFERSGVQVDDGTSVTSLVPGRKWAMESNMNGQQRRFEIAMEPQYWEPVEGGIRFIKSLDHLWIYR